MYYDFCIFWLVVFFLLVSYILEVFSISAT